ncbi:DNL-type zinc finger protein-like [Chelonus insularis]|uniref:DNL-type zinc finger protein-like n=1 Tax=Chelonus insularis TaxID=460826 RepID=UPI00158EAB9E|nr:DNL-type zinc finger protein-like [Chelonus insularis]XP_034948839.1 DNL-type zinc finger protein-like [Chelonus insularis]XP_034948840.1 DNL-type zinc finger protein-like [Chelonus insularis]
MLGLRNFLTLLKVSSRQTLPPFVLQSPRNLLHHLFQNKNWFHHSSIKYDKPEINQVEPKPEEKELTKHRVGALEGRLMIKFKCKKCSTKNTHTMSKLAYTKGIVIICCDGCKNNHLIADNLGWFGVIDSHTNIEKIMLAKGEKVRRINSYGEVFEAVETTDAPKD